MSTRPRSDQLPEILMPALKKLDLNMLLHENVHIQKRSAKEFVDHFFDIVQIALTEGESVKLSGFGHFELREKLERPGRNPKTGEKVPIPARRVVTFRPGQRLKGRIDTLSAEDIAH